MGIQGIIGDMRRKKATWRIATCPGSGDTAGSLVPTRTLVTMQIEPVSFGESGIVEVNLHDIKALLGFFE